jgi:hypothetical protein
VINQFSSLILGLLVAFSQVFKGVDISWARDNTVEVFFRVGASKYFSLINGV